MAQIEGFYGTLRRVDTTKKELTLAVQINPPEEAVEDRVFQYVLDDDREDEWFVKNINHSVHGVMVDGVIKEINELREY